MSEKIPSLDDAECDFCYKRAVMFSVHGWRCQEHRWQKMPSVADPVITICYGTDGNYMIHHKLPKGVWNALYSKR